MRLFPRRKPPQQEASPTPTPVLTSYSSLPELLRGELQESLHRTLVATPQGKVALYTGGRLLLAVNSLGLYRALRVRLATPQVENPLREYDLLRARKDANLVERVYRDAALGALLYLDSLTQNNKLSCATEDVLPEIAEVSKAWTFLNYGEDKVLATVKEAQAFENEGIYRLSLLSSDWLHTPLVLKKRPITLTDEDNYLLTKLQEGGFVVNRLMNNPDGFVTARLLTRLIAFFEKSYCEFLPPLAVETPVVGASPVEVPAVGPQHSVFVLPERDDLSLEDQAIIAHTLLPGVPLVENPKQVEAAPAEQFYPVPLLTPSVEEGSYTGKVAAWVKELKLLEEAIQQEEGPLEEETNRYQQEMFSFTERRLSHDLKELQNDNEGKANVEQLRERERILAKPRQGARSSFKRLVTLERKRYERLLERDALLENLENSGELTEGDGELVRRKREEGNDIPLVAYDPPRG